MRRTSARRAGAAVLVAAAFLLTLDEGGLLLVVSHLLREPAGHTRAWLAFAEWATHWF